MSTVFNGSMYPRNRIWHDVTVWEVEESIQWGAFYAALDLGAL